MSFSFKSTWLVELNSCDNEFSRKRSWNNGEFYVDVIVRSLLRYVFQCIYSNLSWLFFSRNILTWLRCLLSLRKIIEYANNPKSPQSGMGKSYRPLQFDMPWTFQFELPLLSDNQLQFDLHQHYQYELVMKFGNKSFLISRSASSSSAFLVIRFSSKLRLSSFICVYIAVISFYLF